MPASPPGRKQDKPSRSWITKAASGEKKLAQFLLDQLVPNFRSFLADRTPLIWLLALLTGLTVGYAAIGFLWLIGFFQQFWLGTSEEVVFTVARTLPWPVVLLAPAVGGRRQEEHAWEQREFNEVLTEIRQLRDELRDIKASRESG